MIECTTLYSEKKLVEAETIVFRPSAYGIVLREGALLLVNTKSTGKWFFPGGAIEKGERAEEALRRELQEETGITVTIDRLFKFHESFFYYDPWETAFQNFSLIYQCTPQNFTLSDSQNEKRDEAEKPQWVPIAQLKPKDFQDFAGGVFTELIEEMNENRTL